MPEHKRIWTGNTSVAGPESVIDYDDIKEMRERYGIKDKEAYDELMNKYKDSKAYARIKKLYDIKERGGQDA